MITCLSPAAVNFAENLNSLKYAKRVSRVRHKSSLWPSLGASVLSLIALYHMGGELFSSRWAVYEASKYLLLRTSCLMLESEKMLAEWLPGVRLRHFSPTCAVHIEDCEGWWLSGCRSSVAEHWRLKPEVYWV